jgi:hypothetical protein
MASKRIAPNRKRSLREGEVLVDCTKASVLLERSKISNTEERAAEEIGIPRSVLRRIIGKEKKGQPWAIVAVANANAFAKACGGRLEDIEWSGGAHGPTKENPVISTYLALWRGIHSVSPYVPLTMRCDETPIDLPEIIGLLEKTPNLQIVGPSGCGKTHLLAHLALGSIDYGFIPIITRARHFLGRINTMLDDAVSSATTLRFAELIGISATANVTPVVVIDGINECSPEFLPTLIPALQELRIHTNARIIVSGQTLTQLPSSLRGPTVLLSLPDAEQKRQLVEAYLKRPLPPDARFALDVVASAHDAMVWGEVCDNSKPGSSRYDLYESFARKRLGSAPDVDPAYRALGKLAAEMREKFVFSLPRAAAATTIARTIGHSAHEGAVNGTIKGSGLIDTASGHVAFRHELLQAFFATENLLVNQKATDALFETLARPINAELVEFAFGSFFSSKEVESALAHCRSTSVLLACLAGRCGQVATRTVVDHCVAALDRIAARYCAASFDFAPTDYLRLTIDMSACPLLDGEDQRYLSAASAPEARLLTTFLAALGRIDAKLARERVQLGERYPNQKIGWHQCLFTAVYGHQPVNRRPNLTPDRRPILTLLSDESGR